MKILFNDVIQYSDANDALKSPSLADIFILNSSNEINFNSSYPINSIGIGNFNGSIINISLIDENDIQYDFVINYEQNGLYVLQKELINTKKITITSNGQYIGRLAAGKYIKLGTSIPKEPTLVSTHQSRKTLSGQVIPGAGGYTYWRMSLDTRYKIGREAMDEIIAGYRFQIGKSFPFFIEFEEEQNRLPIYRMYATDTNQSQFSFESSTIFYLFSRRFIFEEAF